MANFTPGPWEAFGARISAMPADPFDSESLSIADCDVDTRIDHDTTAAANARLMAAAPDMIEALRLSWALGHKVYHNANHHEAAGIDWPRVRAAMVAAFAKAGVTPNASNPDQTSGEKL